MRGYRTIVNGYGEPISQSLTIDPSDYVALNFTKPVLGVILSVNPSDTDTNKSAFQTEDRRGYLHTCTVLVVEDGRSSTFILDNVIITPDARTGLDDYYERLPRGCSTTVTGQNWNNQLNNIDPYTLDGDWCVVLFLGGSLDSPFVLRWWPHPRNPNDAATSGRRNPNDPNAQPYLEQAGRFFHRVNGVEHVITRRGDIYISTHLANSTLSFGENSTPVNGRLPRTTEADIGGSVKLWIKSSQTLEVDWNPPVNGYGILDQTDPELPQTNPQDLGEQQDKEYTYIVADQNRVLIEVPEQLEVVSNKEILLTSEEATTITVGADCTLDIDENLSITVSGDVTVSGQTIDIVGGGGVAGTPGSIKVANNEVTLGTGSLGGVVGGTPLVSAIAAFSSALTAAVQTAGPASVYATAVDTAAKALLLAVQQAVSQTTKTG